TDRLGRMVALAVALSLVASVLGYALAVAWDVSIGGMMACVSGAGFALALVFAPRRGLLAGGLARRQARRAAACRTLVAHLWSHHNRPEAAEENTARALREHLHWSEAMARGTILAALDAGLIRREAGLLTLTARGEAEACATLPRGGGTPAAAVRG
ncbi:MAG: metal ABC transporter permease, partial [Thermohalobaculum sp.]|nr:metal ABC transporter permease [Thermohalobaculum sp.]